MKEIVIKLPDEVYKSIINGKNYISYQEYVEEAIKNGKVLPKGHDGLIDVRQCDRKLFYQQCGGADSLITVKSAFDMLMSLPPIIEADKENEKMKKATLNIQINVPDNFTCGDCCRCPLCVEKEEYLAMSGRVVKYAACGIGFSHTTCPLEVKE
jgi:hypothetical protein